MLAVFSLVQWSVGLGCRVCCWLVFRFCLTSTLRFFFCFLFSPTPSLFFSMCGIILSKMQNSHIFLCWNSWHFISPFWWLFSNHLNIVQSTDRSPHFSIICKLAEGTSCSVLWVVADFNHHWNTWLFYVLYKVMHILKTRKLCSV